MTKKQTALTLILSAVAILLLTAVFIAGVMNYCDNIITSATLNHDAQTYAQMSKMKIVAPFIIGSIGLIGVYGVCAILSPG